MFEWIKKSYSDYKENSRQDRMQMIIEKSRDMYQVKEFDGALWLTFNGQYVCPCSMLKGEAIESLSEMRSLYVTKIAKI